MAVQLRRSETVSCFSSTALVVCRVEREESNALPPSESCSLR